MRVFPWKSRTERNADVASARARAIDAEKRAEAAQEGVRKSDQLKKDIQEMIDNNHFIQAIFRDIAGQQLPRSE